MNLNSSLSRNPTISNCWCCPSRTGQGRCHLLKQCLRVGLPQQSATSTCHNICQIGIRRSKTRNDTKSFQISARSSLMQSSFAGTSTYGGIDMRNGKSQTHTHTDIHTDSRMSFETRAIPRTCSSFRRAGIEYVENQTSAIASPCFLLPCIRHTEAEMHPQRLLNLWSFATCALPPTPNSPPANSCRGPDKRQILHDNVSGAVHNAQS